MSFYRRDTSCEVVCALDIATAAENETAQPPVEMRSKKRKRHISLKVKQSSNFFKSVRRRLTRLRTATRTRGVTVRDNSLSELSPLGGETKVKVVEGTLPATEADGRTDSGHCSRSRVTTPGNTTDVDVESKTDASGPADGLRLCERRKTAAAATSTATRKDGEATSCKVSLDATAGTERHQQTNPLGGNKDRTVKQAKSKRHCLDHEGRVKVKNKAGSCVKKPQDCEETEVKQVISSGFQPGSSLICSSSDSDFHHTHDCVGTAVNEDFRDAHQERVLEESIAEKEAWYANIHTNANVVDAGFDRTYDHAVTSVANASADPTTCGPYSHISPFAASQSQQSFPQMFHSPQPKMASPGQGGSINHNYTQLNPCRRIWQRSQFSPGMYEDLSLAFVSDDSDLESESSSDSFHAHNDDNSKQTLTTTIRSEGGQVSAEQQRQQCVYDYQTEGSDGVPHGEGVYYDARSDSHVLANTSHADDDEGDDLYDVIVDLSDSDSLVTTFNDPDSSDDLHRGRTEAWTVQRPFAFLVDRNPHKGTIVPLTALETRAPSHWCPSGATQPPF